MNFSIAQMNNSRRDSAVSLLEVIYWKSRWAESISFHIYDVFFLVLLWRLLSFFSLSSPPLSAAEYSKSVMFVYSGLKKISNIYISLIFKCFQRCSLYLFALIIRVYVNVLAHHKCLTVVYYRSSFSFTPTIVFLILPCGSMALMCL